MNEVRYDKSSMASGLHLGSGLSMEQRANIPAMSRASALTLAAVAGALLLTNKSARAQYTCTECYANYNGTCEYGGQMLAQGTCIGNIYTGFPYGFYSVYTGFYNGGIAGWSPCLFFNQSMCSLYQCR